MKRELEEVGISSENSKRTSIIHCKIKGKLSFETLCLFFFVLFFFIYGTLNKLQYFAWVGFSD